MTTEHLDVTLTSLGSIDWKSVLANVSRPRCRDYSRLFLEQALNEEETHGDSSSAATWRLLAALTSANLLTDSTKSPFPTDWIASFSVEHLTVFEALATQVEDAELKARLCDLLWLRLRRPDFARASVTAYLASAFHLEGDTSWVHSARRYERAVHLGRSISKKRQNAPEFDLALQTVESVLMRLNGEDELYFSAALAELLQYYKAGNQTSCAAVAEKAALRHERGQDWGKARRYREIQAEWLWLADDNEAARQARIESIELYVKEARYLAEQTEEGVRYLRACTFLERAIKAWRELGGAGSSERRADIYQLLRQYQPLGIAELPPLRVEYDEKMRKMDAEISEAIMSGIYDQSLLLALTHLACFPFMNGAAQLRNTCEEYLRRSPVAMLFPFKAHTSIGLVAGRPASSPMSEEERLQIEVDHHWYHYGNEVRNHTVLRFIVPAIEALKDEHSPQPEDLRVIVQDNPFIPQGREYLFLIGLQAGLAGDFVTAVHILVPQLENALRALLEERNITTSAFDRQDIQNQFDLNRMFTTPELEAALVEIFDVNVIFHLKGALVHRFGANLRNELAHGTLGVGEFNGFYGPQCIFVWWMCLHLCCCSFLSNLVEKRHDQEKATIEESAAAPPLEEVL